MQGCSEMSRRYNKWVLSGATKLGGVRSEFRSDYRDTAKHNAGKRLAKYLDGWDIDPSYILHMKLSNGIYTYHLTGYNAQGWVWDEEMGPGR